MAIEHAMTRMVLLKVGGGRLFVFGAGKESGVVASLDSNFSRI